MTHKNGLFYFTFAFLVTTQTKEVKRILEKLEQRKENMTFSLTRVFIANQWTDFAFLRTQT